MIVVGWDLGEVPPAPLSGVPDKALKEIKLVECGSGADVIGVFVLTVDVWGLDPRLNVAGMLDWRDRNRADNSGGTGVEVAATLAVSPIRRREDGSVMVFPALELWPSSSPVAVPNCFDLATAFPGVRLTLTVTPGDVSLSHSDLFLTLQARPNERLGSDGLAEELIHRMKVYPPELLQL